MAAKCPICKQTVKARAENPAFPFCSARCKTIDLGNWVSEAYRVPGEPAEPDDVEELVQDARRKLHS